MLYLQQTLTDNEELIHIGRFHWMYTFQAVMSIVWGVVFTVLFLIGAYYIQDRFMNTIETDGFIDTVQAIHPGLRLMSLFIFILGILRFAQMMVVKATTEIAVTTSRLIYKRGLVARHVGEMSIDRIEGVNVLQSLFGRLFNYGRLAIRGMGVGEVVLPPIDNPLLFRRAIEKARTT